MQAVKDSIKRLWKQGKANQFQKTSFAQSGEDIITDFVLCQLHINKPIYLDIGAHHPHYLSNTFYFYEKGYRGINIEPDPFLIEGFKKMRSEDINLNVGVGLNKKKDSVDFFVMSTRTLNTFSKKEAERIASYGNNKIEQVIKVPLVPVNDIIDENCRNGYPNFVSLDVEGLDFEILKSFNFQKYMPEVLCVETLTYSENKSERKLDEIITYVCSKGYFVYADTYINTIFVNCEAWKNR
jgi:FkbM family methyltransferase